MSDADPGGAAPSTRAGTYRIGFAGSRFLFEPRRLPPERSRALEDALLPLVVERLRAWPQRLGVAADRPLCGLSQLAIGADTVFTRACVALGWRQRLLLPQPTAEFLDAGEPGEPDFSAEERATAHELLRLPHIEGVEVASRSNDRIVRFEDTNRAILQASDAVVCLVREGAQARPGGTRDLMQRALDAGKPVGLLLAGLDAQGRPRLSPWSGA